MSGKHGSESSLGACEVNCYIYGDVYVVVTNGTGERNVRRILFNKEHSFLNSGINGGKALKLRLS